MKETKLLITCVVCSVTCIMYLIKFHTIIFNLLITAPVTAVTLLYCIGSQQENREILDPIFSI